MACTPLTPSQVKDSVDEKRIHERKGASITKDLRRQLAQERRRADRLQQALQDTSFSDKPGTDGVAGVGRVECVEGGVVFRVCLL